MSKVVISGVIGLDVMPADVRAQLVDKDGPIEVHLSSPGGFIPDGIEIFNLLKEYDGEVTIKIMGLAASMGAYIAMAGDKIQAKENSVLMIHNAQAIMVGDNRDMAKMAEELEKWNALLAKPFQAKTGKSAAKIRALMDAETWYFGSEIVKNKFATEIEGGDGTEKSEAMDAAKFRFAACLNRIEAKKVENRLMPVSDTSQSMSNTEPQNEPSPTPSPAAIDAAYAAGVKAESARILALREYSNADPQNVKVRDIVESAILEGKSVADVQARLNVAIRDGGREGDNPPEVNVQNTNALTLSADELAACKAFGLTPEQYLAGKRS